VKDLAASAPSVSTVCTHVTAH